MGGNFSRTLTVLSDSINPVVRSTCGGFCALTTVNCAPRLRIVVDFLEEMRKKASRLVKTYHFASPTPTFCFQFEERKTEREREQTKPIIHRFYTIPLRRRRQSASFAVGGFDGDERRGGDAGSGSKHFFFLVMDVFCEDKERRRRRRRREGGRVKIE